MEITKSAHLFRKRKKAPFFYHQSETELLSTPHRPALKKQLLSIVRTRVIHRYSIE